MAAVRPVLYGYQVVRVTTPRERVERNRLRLAAFAAVEGYSLGSVFVEWDASKPWVALASLIEAAQRSTENVAAVAVPRITDLGLTPLMQAATLRRLEDEAGVRVIVLGRAA